MKANILFYLAVSLLLTHELDAVANTEWRLLYFLRDLSDASAYPIFIILHVAIFMAVFIFTHHNNRKIRNWFRNGICLFLVIHSLIHFRLIGTDGYTFHGILSNSLIFGAALLGLAYLIFFGLRKNA